jgi:ribose 5-phosphate isomerase B
MKRGRDEDAEFYPPLAAPCTSIAFGSDHAGCALKQQLMAHVRSAYPRIAIHDFGTESEEKRADYPDIAAAVCGSMLDGSFARGVLLDGAGVASGIAANKFRGIRAGVVHDHFSASMARKHNDANVFCLGGKTLGLEAAKEVIDVFINCEFEGERHIPRLRKLKSLEEGPSGLGSGSPRRPQHRVELPSGGPAAPAMKSPYKLV